MIKGILFDVGGTLITPTPSVGKIYSDVSAQFGLKKAPHFLQSRFKKEWALKIKSTEPINKLWWRSLVKRIFKDLPIPHFNVFFETLYREFEKTHRWKIYPDVVPTLVKCKKRGLTLSVASNWDSRLSKLLKDLDLSKYFDNQSISINLGYMKPHPFFFKKALKKMKCKPDEVFHIGDDPLRDLKGAHHFGIRSFLIKRGNRFRGRSSLSSLSQLLNYL